MMRLIPHLSKGAKYFGKRICCFQPNIKKKDGPLLKAVTFAHYIRLYAYIKMKPYF